jgi:hypothetical protein
MSKITEARELSRKLSIVAQHESRFNAAVQRAQACKYELDQAFIDSVKRSFEELRARVKQEPTDESPALSLEAVEEQAGRISRLRVYILPMAEALNVGLSVISDLRDWRVPQEALDATAPLLTEARGTDDGKARAAIHNLLFMRDSWNSQFRRYFENVNWMTKRLTILLAVLAAATGIVQSFSIALAFVLAGLCGTTASILMKPPVLTVFGESIGLFNRTIGRYSAGLIASIAGFGLLSSNFLNLNLGDFKSTAQIIDGIELCQPIDTARKALGARHTPRPGDMSRDTGGASDAGTLDGGTGLMSSADAGVPDAGTEGSTFTPGPGAPPEPEPSPSGTVSSREEIPMCNGVPCDCTIRLRWVAFLLTLGILFGFSERAVSSFEDMIVSRWNPPVR